VLCPRLLARGVKQSFRARHGLCASLHSQAVAMQTEKFYGDCGELLGAAALLSRPAVLHRVARALYCAAAAQDQYAELLHQRVQVLLSCVDFAMHHVFKGAPKCSDSGHSRGSEAAAELFPEHLATACRLKARETAWLEPLIPFLEAELHAAMAGGKTAGGGVHIPEPPAGSLELRCGVSCLGEGSALQSEHELTPDARAELCRTLATALAWVSA
jgi:hypothetical protein